MSLFLKTKVLLVLAIVFGMTGCGDTVARRERRAAEDPRIQAARQFERSGDISDAIKKYEEILEGDSGATLAGLEMAILLQDNRQDQKGLLKAAYHYQRYLEQNPDSEKRALVESRYRITCRLLASVLSRSGKADANAPIVESIALSKDSSLQKQAANESTTGPAKPKPAGKDNEKIKTGEYVVQSGDSLSKIAGKVYGDESKWESIYEANRKVLESSSNLKVGQVLVVPGLRRSK